MEEEEKEEEGEEVEEEGVMEERRWSNEQLAWFSQQELHQTAPSGSVIDCGLTVGNTVC